MDETVRVAVFYQHMPPCPAAAALRGHTVVRGLVASSCFGNSRDIRVFTTTPAATLIVGATIIRLDAPQGDNSLGIVARLMDELRIGWEAVRAIDSCRNTFDILLVSSPGYLPALLISLFARLRRIKYVLDIRDLYPQVYADASLINKNSLLYQCLWRLSRTIYRGASLITTVTHGLAHEISTITPASRVVCVYNGFPQDLITRNAIKRDRFTVCFHGIIGFMQDVKTMIAIAKFLHKNDIDFVVIGYGKYADALRQCHSLQFYGQMPFDKTIDEVARCHIGLSLRVGGKISRDAFPVKIWEYIGLGIPSIVTPRCEAGDFLEKHECGLQFTEGDADGVGKAIIRLKENPDALGVMASKCREVSAGHTREQAGMEIAELVAQSISQPRKQRSHEYSS